MTPESPANAAVFRYLSGARRGHAQIADVKTLHIFRSGERDVRLQAPDGQSGEEPLATLHRAGDSYELEIVGAGELWVNGQRVAHSRVLNSGDLLELGHGGPVLRFRLYPPGAAPKKSLAEALADSIDGARADGQSNVDKAGRFFAGFARDLATQTTLWFRIWMMVLITALVVSVVVLVVQNLRLQKQLSMEVMRIDSIAEALAKTGAEAMRRQDLAALRKEVEGHLAEAARRVETLEARSHAMARAIAAAAESIAFVQGAFGFVDAEEDRPLRYVESPDGGYLFTFDERGEVVELTFTGTAFAISAAGMLMTNKHVAEPWLIDERIKLPRELGVRPVIQRLRVFFPGTSEPIAVDHLLSSGKTDLALLKIRRRHDTLKGLTLETSKPRPGDEVLVMGYPLGMSGMLARASQEFVETLTPDSDTDFWTVGERLSAAGYVQPLASRGIVSQVSDDYIVYDADTAIGGSGGPVLDLDGRVIAVNTAVVGDYGGSNLGVPAIYAQQMLDQPAAAE